MIKDWLDTDGHARLIQSPSAGSVRVFSCGHAALLAILLVMASGIFAQTAATQKDAPLYNEVQQALEKGDYDRAIEIYRKLIGLEGNSASLLLQLGVAQYQKGDYDSAAQSLRRSLQMQPHVAVAEAFLGLSEAARGNSDVSIPLLEKSFASHDRTVDQELKRIVGSRLGEIYADKGRLREAEALYMSLLKDFPDDPQVLYQSFWVYMSIGRQVMNTLLREAPNSYRTHKLIGLLLLEKGNYAGAAEQFQQALKEYPTAPGLHYELGILKLRSSDENGATKDFEEELRLHPFHAPSYYQLAESRARVGELDRASELYGKALQCNPTFSDALVGLCRVSLTKNQPRDVLSSCQKATTIAPGNRPAHYLLARVYRTLGQSSMADAELALFERLQRESTAQLDFLNEAQIGAGSER